MNRRRAIQLNRIAWYRRLADLKEDSKATGCRAWIAKIGRSWKWSGSETQQLPNPFQH